MNRLRARISAAVTLVLILTLFLTVFAPLFTTTTAAPRDAPLTMEERPADRGDAGNYTLLIDLGNGSYHWHTDLIPAIPNATAFNATVDATTALGLAFEYESYPYGPMVTQIGALENAADWSEFWNFLVWNETAEAWETASVGAGAYELAPGDIIAWHYDSWGDAPPVPTPLDDDPTLVAADILVDIGDGVHWHWEDVTLNAASGHTAYHALEAGCAQLGFELNATESEMGIFVDSINGTANAADWSEFWNFLVWNETAEAWEVASVGVSSYNITADTLAIALLYGAWGETPRPTPLLKNPEPRPEPMNGAITGRVVDGDTGVALANATVRIYQNATLVSSTTTNATGAFFAEALPPGDYFLNCSAENYGAQRSAAVTVIEGETTTLAAPVALGDRIPPAPIEATLGSEESSDGDRVTVHWHGYKAPLDIDHYAVYLSVDPITSIAALNATKTLPARVNSTTVTGLEMDRTYHIAVVPVDHEGNYVPAVTSVAVTPTANAVILPIVIGPVTDEEGEPLEAVKVTLAFENESYTNTTDARGYSSFDLPHTWDGTAVTLAFEKDGYRPRSQVHTLSTTSNGEHYAPLSPSAMEPRSGSAGSSLASLPLFLLTLVGITIAIVVVVIVVVIILVKRH